MNLFDENCIKVATFINIDASIVYSLSKKGVSSVDLVDRLMNKEESALIEVMNQYGDYLLRTAILLLKDKQTAEEAVQDTFITAYEKVNQLSDPKKLKSWLTSILVNRCRSQIRKRSWKQRILSIDLIQHYKGDETFSGPEEHFINLVENQYLAEGIQELDYKYREVIILFYFNEMKINEISQYLNTKENTIKSRLARGRSMLKEIFMRGGDGSGE
jgi:RNA polymerase sigma factor (sigma-70 family)